MFYRNKMAQTWFVPFCSFLILVIATLLLSGCASDDSRPFESSCVEGNCTHPLDVLNPTNVLKTAKFSRVKFVGQIDQRGCGAATLSSVLSYWDKPVTYESIVSKYPSASVEGYSVGELKSIAVKYNLLAYSMQISEKTLKENLAKGRPIIVAVKKYIFKHTSILPDFIPFKDKVTYSHFLVIFGFSEKGYWVMDPAEGYMYLAAETLKEMWNRQRFVGLLISSKAY